MLFGGNEGIAAIDVGKVINNFSRRLSNSEYLSIVSMHVQTIQMARSPFPYENGTALLN